MGAHPRGDEIRQRIDHPVVDGDMHWLEPLPVFLEFVRNVGGGGAVDSYRASLGSEAKRRWYELSTADRIDQQLMRPAWWTFPTNTLDFATVSLPDLLRERLDEFGIDFAVVYPTIGLFAALLPDPELRQICCRAYNTMAHSLFSTHADRLTPAAIIPTVTPEEGIAELDFAVGELGMKAMVINGHAVRSIGGAQGSDPSVWTPVTAQYVDFHAMDSPYDYDPLWQRCVDLRVPVTAHGSSYGWMDRRSPTSFVFNHLGLFSNANYGFCKALVLGGVPGRFPTLRFAFLEGGIAWATSLYNDIVGHWEKRSRRALDENLRPTLLDVEELHVLWRKYGASSWQEMFEDFISSPVQSDYGATLQEMTERDAEYDEFTAIGDDIGTLKQWFGEHFYFGCEADDRTMSTAFKNNLGIALKPVLGSDIGHWDVPVMAEILAEAYELLAEGMLSAEQFRGFTCNNVMQLYVAMNPDFFRDTSVEQDLVSRA